MNRVELIGRLTKDPELRYTKDNIAICTFTIAINRPYTKEQETDYILCKAFNKLGENIQKYCTKGKLLAVEGRIQTSSYEKDDKKYYTTEIISDNVEFLSPKEEKKDTPKEEPIKENTMPDAIFEAFGEGNFDDDGIAF